MPDRSTARRRFDGDHAQDDDASVSDRRARPTGADLLAAMPFGRALEIELQEASPDQVMGSLPWAPQRCTTGGILHGGVLMSFADSLGAICAFLNLAERATTSTIESKTNFFRAVRSGTLHGLSRPLHVGRTTIAVQTELRDDGGRLVGVVTQTQAVLDSTPVSSAAPPPPAPPP
jgi:uncharacterized protein (TIGR00369 family)